MQLDQILSFVFILVNIYVASTLLTFKYHKKDRILVYLYPVTIHILLSIYTISYHHQSIYIVYPVLLSVLYFIALVLSFKEALHIKLFIYFFSLFSVLSIGTISRALQFQSLPLWMILLFISIFVFAFIGLNYWIIVFNKHKFTELKLILDKKQWNFFNLFILFNIIYLLISRENIFSYDLILVISFQFLLHLYFVFLIYGFGAKFMDFTMQEQISRQLSIEEDYVEHFRIKIDEFRKLKHDFRFHLHTIAQLIHTEEEEEALRYINDLNKTIESIDTAIYCSNNYINAIVSSYANLCSDSNINFTTQLDIQELKITNIDLSILLNNALSNAYEACKKVNDEQPEINIISKMNNHFLAIRVSNTYNGIIKKEDNLIISTKEERGHGIGLQSIQSIVDKYKGQCNITYTDHQFTLELLIQLT